MNKPAPMNDDNGAKRLGDVARQLDQVQSIVGTARRLLAQGNTVDLSKLEARVEALCKQATELPAGSADAIRPKMVALIDELNTLSQEMKEQYEGLRENLTGLAAGQRAQSAYRKPQGGS